MRCIHCGNGVQATDAVVQALRRAHRAAVNRGVGLEPAIVGESGGVLPAPSGRRRRCLVWRGRPRRSLVASGRECASSRAVRARGDANDCPTTTAAASGSRPGGASAGRAPRGNRLARVEATRRTSRAARRPCGRRLNSSGHEAGYSDGAPRRADANGDAARGRVELTTAGARRRQHRDADQGQRRAAGLPAG